MGVLRVSEEPKLIKVQEITYADYVFDDETEGEEEDEAHVTPNTPATPSRRRRQKQVKLGSAEKKIQRFLEMDAVNGGMKVKRCMGSRKVRRLENARLMYALADPDDICDDYSDILPATVTAFAKLFIDEQNMKAWNEFIEKDEEEQNAFLNGLETGDKKHEKNLGNRVGGRRGRARSECPEQGSRHSEGDKDSRNHHPAYSAESCFARMDTRFKALFSQRRLPWEFIAKIESDLLAFFLNEPSPSSLWSSSPIPSFHRLIVHGICQFLSLHSFSSTDTKGEKFVSAINKGPFFIPPHKKLLAYISQLHKAQRVKWRRSRT